MKSVYQIAAGLGALATWVAAIEVVGLVDLLKGDDYITVFAPNDEAFSKRNAMVSDLTRLSVYEGRYHSASLAKCFRAAVSMHCHTNHSRELLTFIPHYVRRIPRTGGV